MLCHLPGLTNIKAAAPLALACLTLWILVLPGLAQAQGYSVDLTGHEYDVAPGGELTGQIRIANMEDDPVTVKLWLSDIVRTAEPVESYDNNDELGTEPRSLAPWMSLPQPEVTIPAHDFVNVPYQVRLPSDATLSGSYWVSVMVAKAKTQEEIEELLQPEAGKMRIGIRTEFRYNVRVIITIPGTKHPAGKFASAELKREEVELRDKTKLTRLSATAVFANEDAAFVRPAAVLDIRDTTGKSVYKSEPQERTVLPQSSLCFVFDLGTVVLDPGQYIALVVADYGVPKLVGAQLKLDYTAADRENALAFDELKRQQEAERVAREAAAAPPAQ